MAALRLLLLGILAFTIYYAVNNFASDEPGGEARRFLRTLQLGEPDPVVLQFGDNTCGCQPRGGYIAYLKYESGEPENLAFLLGKDFEVGKMTEKSVPTKMKFEGGNLPWEQPESSQVDVPVKFQSYQPYFLPLDTAYGYPIKQADLDTFSREPQKNFDQALALRLRPTLEPGLIPPPPPTDKAVFTADVFKKLLSKDEGRYLRPSDPGTVEGSAGAVPVFSVADKLPRLKEATLRMLVVRRSKYKHWQVKKVTVLDPVFILPDGSTAAGKTDEAH